MSTSAKGYDPLQITAEIVLLTHCSEAMLFMYYIHNSDILRGVF